MKKISFILFLVVLVSCRKDTDFTPVVYVSPTSVKTELNINIYHNKNNNFDVILHNTLGNEILTKSVLNSNEITINVEGIKKGIYFVTVIGTNVSTSTKIVKE